jgi:putative ABC transport system substrate-binding protein
MDRRRFLFTVLAVSTPVIAEAQQPRPVRIGWLSIAPHPFITAFRAGLRELGYLEGQGLIINERYAEGQPDRLLGLARELVAQRVDIFVTSGGQAALAAAKATTAVPIVAITANLVGVGLVRSLPHPGGNVTGLDLLSADLSVKWLELLRAAIPNLTRVGVLVDTSGIVQPFEQMTAAVSSLDVQLVRLGARDAASIAAAFTEAVRQRVRGLIPLSSPVFATHKQEIVALAAKHRMPAMYEHRDFVDAGGLMSYGPNLNDVYRRAAVYVDKILKGGKPADLPVEQPTKYEFVINLKTAKALGLTIPQSTLLRADQVIE